MKRKILQKIADFIVNKVKNSSTKTDAEAWFKFGLKYNKWCIRRGFKLA